MPRSTMKQARFHSERACFAFGARRYCLWRKAMPALLAFARHKKTRHQAGFFVIRSVAACRVAPGGEL
jgi:hypothetical protein